jgi:hypothetical protein
VPMEDFVEPVDHDEDHGAEEFYEMLFFDDNSEDDPFDLMESGDEEEEVLPNGRRRNRDNYERGPKRLKPYDRPEDTYWMRLINQPDINDPRSRNAKDFRQKFRVPFPVFNQILDMCRMTEESCFVYAEKDCTGKSSIPLELKVLAVLRVFSGGMKFGDAAELSGFLSTSVVNKFFRDFCRFFTLYFQHDVIKPLSGEALKRSMEIYSKLGLPGCVGSIDCTFVPWEKCSHFLKNVCGGDKGQGFLFEVVVDHNRFVLSVQGPYYATINDKNSVKYSEFLDAMRNENFIQDVAYKVRTGPTDEEYIILKYCYVIADGGYLQEPSMICAYPSHAHLRIQYKFSDWIGSVRKDVECFFGILKQRFRFFKNPITLQSEEDIKNAFVTACMIHNLILVYDGLDMLWEHNVNWSQMDPEADPDEDNENNIGNPVAGGDNNNGDVDQADTVFLVYNPQEHGNRPVMTWDTLLVGEGQNDIDGDEDIDGDLANFEPHTMRNRFEKLRDLIAGNLHFTYQSGKLKWPKQRSEIEDVYNQVARRLFPLGGEL